MSQDQAQSSHLQRLVNAVFLISFPFGLLMFALPIVGKEMGASALVIAGLYSVFSLVTVLLRPLVGWALDRYGRRPFLIGGLAGYLVANLAFLWAGQVITLYLARIAQSVGSSLMWLAAYAIVADLSPPRKRGRNFGRVEQSSSQAMIAGMFVFLAAHTVVGRLNPPGGDVGSLAWKASFGVFAALGAFSIWRVRHLPETGAPRERAAFWSSSRPIWERLSRQLAVLMGIVLLTSAATQAISPIVLIYLQDRFNAGPFELAWAYLPMALVWAFLPSRMGAIGDRVGRKLPMALGLLVSGTVTLFLPLAPSLLLLAVLWVIEAVAFTAAVPAEEALVADTSGSEQRGMSFGFYAFASGLGAIIGPFVGGWLYDRVGHTAPFYFTAALVFVGALLIVLLVREPERSVAAQQSPDSGNHHQTSNPIED